MITTDAYNQLPAREKPNWHYHKIEFALNRADPKSPLLSEHQQNVTLKKLEESYGKVILTWNPSDKKSSISSTSHTGAASVYGKYNSDTSDRENSGDIQSDTSKINHQALFS